MKMLRVLMIAFSMAALSVFGLALPRAEHRGRRERTGYGAVYPRFVVWAYLRLSRFIFETKRSLKYDFLETSAFLLAFYCMITRQEGFEGFRMSYWRWLATIHLAIKERDQLATATALGYRMMHGSGGARVWAGGQWRSVPAGGAKTRVGQVSPLYYKKVAGGLPVLMDMTVFPGNIFFVDSGETADGSDTAGYGTHPDKPFVTTDFAISQCTADQGDVIFLLPGDNEGLTTGQTIDLDVGGISVIGVGNGNNRPRIDFDIAAASIDIGASGCMIKNIQLLPSVTDVLIAIDCETLFTDHVLEDIEILPGEDGAGVDDFAAGIEMKVGITRCLIKGFLADEYAASAGYYRAIYFNGASTRVHIKDCWLEVSGAAAVACIEGTGSSLRSLIENCTLITDAEPGIELAAGQTGVIRDVDIFADLGTIAAATVAAGMAHFRVRYVEVGNESDAAVKTASVDD